MTGNSRYTPVLLVTLAEKDEKEKKRDQQEIKSIEETIRWNETVAEPDEEDQENPDALKILGFLVTVPGPGPGGIHIFSCQCDLAARHAEAIKKMELKNIKTPALPVIWAGSDHCPLCAVLENLEPGTRIRDILNSPISGS